MPPICSKCESQLTFSDFAEFQTFATIQLRCKCGVWQGDLERYFDDTSPDSDSDL